MVVVRGMCYQKQSQGIQRSSTTGYVLAASQSIYSIEDMAYDIDVVPILHLHIVM